MIPAAGTGLTCNRSDETMEATMTAATTHLPPTARPPPAQALSAASPMAGSGTPSCWRPAGELLPVPVPRGLAFGALDGVDGAGTPVPGSPWVDGPA
jgi:hypothetical protein